MENKDLRLFARGQGVRFWKVAKAMSISEPTMTRKLRSKLSEDEERKIRQIILKIAEGGETA